MKLKYFFIVFKCRIYKIPDGKPENKFAFDGEYQDAEFANKIISEKITTLVIMRLSDGACTIAHKNACKKYTPNIRLFNSLPDEIKQLCTELKDNNELSKEKYHLLLKYDNFETPQPVLDLLGQDPMEILKKEFSDDDNPRPGTSRD